jgi:hypothetical protein
MGEWWKSSSFHDLTIEIFKDNEGISWYLSMDVSESSDAQKLFQEDRIVIKFETLAWR